ncbi:MAG: hypothetical protein KC561_01405 [Myxococcales bacterium]|nr:hypothetical protein [Myxococcales bacterium]
MATTITTSFGRAPSRGLLGALICALFLVAWSSTAFAHDLQEHRHIVLSVSEYDVKLLIAYEVPAGPEAERLRAMGDFDRDGSLETEGYEGLAQYQALLPRLLAGIVIARGDVALDLELEGANFQDGAGDGPRRGLTGMALYSAQMELPDSASFSVELSEATVPTVLEFQTEPPVVITASEPAPLEGAYVVPAVTLEPGVVFTATVGVPSQ